MEEKMVSCLFRNYDKVFSNLHSLLLEFFMCIQNVYLWTLMNSMLSLQLFDLSKSHDFSTIEQAILFDFCDEENDFLLVMLVIFLFHWGRLVSFWLQNSHFFCYPTRFYHQRRFGIERLRRFEHIASLNLASCSGKPFNRNRKEKYYCR